jgi:hypothetical protein
MTVPTGSASVYASSFTSGAIAAGGSQPVTIQFAPTAAIAYDGTLTVNGDQTSGTNTISISGAGIGLVPLSGRVTDSGGVKGINGTSVTVLDGANAGRTTTTTTTGDYRFDNLTVGNANLSANASGYAQTINGVFINGANTRNFTLLLSPTPVPSPPTAPPISTIPSSCTAGPYTWDANPSVLRCRNRLGQFALSACCGR